MGRERFYKPGSFYRVCDRTGFVNRAERTKKQWNNVIVRDRSFEMRQPQDFVRGRTDPQIVPEPRPRSPDRFVSTAVVLPNLIASSDQQALGWPGLLSGPAVVIGSGVNSVVMLLGGSIDSGVYEIPVATDVDAGAVRNLQVRVDMSYLGWPNGQNVALGQPTPIDLFTRGDLFSMPDAFAKVPSGTASVVSLIPSVWNAFVSARVEIAMAGDDGAWSVWKDAANTIYRTRYMKFRIVFASFDMNTSAFIIAFKFQVGLA